MTRSFRARVVRALALVCLGAVTLTGCDFSVYSLPLPGGADLGDHPYKVTVEFRDVLDLVPQSAVKVDDVTVGRVDDIKLDGYTADVTVLLRNGVKLPDDAVADIRQTSLLGEKFVSLSAPADGTGTGRLADGDGSRSTAPAATRRSRRSSVRCPCCSTAAAWPSSRPSPTELNKALDGRESRRPVRARPARPVHGAARHPQGRDRPALESLDRWRCRSTSRRRTIELALDELPARGRVDQPAARRPGQDAQGAEPAQRVGTRVIGQSKQATIDSLNALAPTLTKLAEAGDALPKSLQVFLTYPFVDAVVGKNPAQARNLHMGDYTNLSIKTDLDLTKLAAPGLPPTAGPDRAVQGDPAQAGVRAAADLGDQGHLQEHPRQPAVRPARRRGGRRRAQSAGSDPGSGLHDSRLLCRALRPRGLTARRPLQAAT